MCKFLCVLFIALVLYDEAGRQAKIDEKIFPKIKVTGSIRFALVLFDNKFNKKFVCVFYKFSDFIFTCNFFLTRWTGPPS